MEQVRVGNRFLPAYPLRIRLPRSFCRRVQTFNPSHRLIGELIGYPWSGVHCGRRQQIQTSSLNRLGNQSQILCGVSLVRGNESLY